MTDKQKDMHTDPLLSHLHFWLVMWISQFRVQDKLEGGAVLNLFVTHFDGFTLLDRVATCKRMRYTMI